MRKIINKLKLSGFKKQASASISKANDYRGYEFEQLVTAFNKCKDKVELFALLTEISERTVGLRPYKVQIMVQHASYAFVNRTGNDANSANIPRGASSITLQEIAQ